MMPPLRWVAAVAVAGALAGGLTAAEVGGAPQGAAVVLFLSVTGLSVAPLLDVRSPLALVVATVALSLVLDTLAATALLAADRFSAEAGLAAVAAACLPGCAVQLARRVRRARVTEVRVHA